MSYEGKFNAKARGQENPGETLENILRERQNAIEKRAAMQANRGRRPASAPAASHQQPVSGAPRQNPAPSTSRPAPARTSAAAQQNMKAPKTEVQKTQSAKRKGPRLGGTIFYSVYFLFIFVFFVGIFGVLNWLNGWLKAYEEAQPTAKCEEVFNQLFRDPDWAQLYQLAGVQDTDFEGIDQYVAYMENKVGGQELNYVETSGGLAGKKYIVRLGTEKLATFMLEGGGKSVIDIPNWTLGQIELFFSRNESIKIKKLENHVAYVNGVPLDDSYTIQIASTKADEMMPVGTATVRTSIQCIDGLMAVPEITVYDETGTTPTQVVYNPDTDMYEEMTDAIVMGEDERNAVFGALEAYAGFMINASGSRAGVAKYFDGSSSTYQDILKMGSELWMNADRGHEFKNKEILGYTKYSDTLFAVRASMNMVANNRDGSTSDFLVRQSMFFTKKNDNWVCYDMTNEDITEPVGKVRLTFCTADGQQLSSDFYDTDAASLITPTISVPEGKVFSGWSRIDVDENNVQNWTIVFRPDEMGNVTLTGGTTLEPMTLYPLFEDAATA